ncbi:SAM-dependent methyltransferase [Bradyrhizobium sp. Bra78]|uniref:SAM-dependent methyltransferase n=1 Tax=Bradyrhizobium sp. Bra78 TaxID=2926010 RepID=UPI0021C81AA9|nr:SAM-dependent methyltransferase [Bradyrhizobium sp. Bra78]
MLASDALADIRTAARLFEENLPPAQRKRLGQFFTGLPLGRLLAHLSLSSESVTILDPMAGNGDLLDAAATAAQERGIAVAQLDGIEVEDTTAAYCRRRADVHRSRMADVKSAIIAGSAFDPAVIRQLRPQGYDLVITNPPYVRYQSQKGDNHGIAAVREGLRTIIDERTRGAERSLWQILAAGYSGLADLSVPAWILSAVLTRPGGRLAIVAPATWRSRDYADIVRYLLLRLFALEFIVDDTQPGWFSDALVRTNLIVARRLTVDQTAVPLTERTSWANPRWLQIAPMAANAESLVGAEFSELHPDTAFALWARSGGRALPHIDNRAFALVDEWKTLEHRLRRKRWFLKVEGVTSRAAVRAQGRGAADVPEPLRALMPAGSALADLQTLTDAQIRVSQGLRTGCNRFFYMTMLAEHDDGTATVEASESFQRLRFKVPKEALRPVLHRQTDIPGFARDQVPRTRVLDLSRWVLPEDLEAVLKHERAYRKVGRSLPRQMPSELAAFVRRASLLALDPDAPSRLIPDLSAVRTNVKLPGRANQIPGFWYMLPAFSARHLPAMFIPRINHGAPAASLNVLPPILIDANFSTLWPEGPRWTNFGLYGLFSSVWCRAGMEALGTPLGGGALKLEATHIRQIPVPVFSDADCQKLGALGHRLAGADSSALADINQLVLAAAFPSANEAALKDYARYMGAQLGASSSARQRIAS